MRRVNILLSLFLFTALAAVSAPTPAAAKDTYPKLANFYLDFFHRSDYDRLSKWDLLVIQAEMTTYNPDFFAQYRRDHPGGILLPYTYPAMFYEEANPSNYAGLPLRKYALDRISQENWWLRDGSGNKVESWPRVSVVNVTIPGWQDFVVHVLRDKLGTESWDGVMYDMVDADIGYGNGRPLDVDRDGQADSRAKVNQLWRQGMVQLFAKTRSMLGPNKVIIGNGNSIDSYQKDINGRIFEKFPTPWEGNGSWQASMYQYLRRLPPLNRTEPVYVLNGSGRSATGADVYRSMRYGLTSTLLGDGYFSFDNGDQHLQQWWYDEYDFNLGRAESSYYNQLNPEDDFVRAGLWRRDFENGVAIVNATPKEQLYVFKHEEFEKLRGTQDPGINNGAKVNYIRLAPNDGIIMRTVRQDVSGQVFANDDFLRVFTPNGQQPRNGFFASKADVAPRARVLLDDLDNNGRLDRIVESKGRLIVSGPGRRTISIAPFGEKFAGRLSFAAYDFNKDGSKEIVVAVASGGGPQVMTYSQTGKRLSAGFFAFDKNFRGGVNIAVADLDRDGKGDIVAAPASGLAPTIKLFNEQGRGIGSFLAYAQNFKGGVNVSVGDVDGDGRTEIVTGPAAGGPHVRIFNSTGSLLGQFMAYDPNGRTGVRVTVSDLDRDGKAEILAGTANF